MEQAGYSAWSRLALDLGFVTFERRFRQLVEETEMVPLEKRKQRPMRQRQKWDRETLLRVLGIDPADAGLMAEAGTLPPVLRESDWAALAWPDDDDLGEGE